MVSEELAFLEYEGVRIPEYFCMKSTVDVSRYNVCVNLMNFCSIFNFDVMRQKYHNSLSVNHEETPIREDMQ